MPKDLLLEDAIGLLAALADGDGDETQRVKAFRYMYRRTAVSQISAAIAAAAIKLGLPNMHGYTLNDLTFGLPRYNIYEESMRELDEAEAARGTKLAAIVAALGTGAAGLVAGGLTVAASVAASLGRLLSRTKWEAQIGGVFAVHAHNRGTLAAAEYAARLGLPVVKTWHTILDGRERLAHHDANGQTVPADLPFIVGGELADYPGDLNLSPGNRINCRCTIVVRLGGA